MTLRHSVHTWCHADVILDVTLMSRYSSKEPLIIGQLIKRATNYRALLRKMTCEEDKASHDSTPPSRAALAIKLQNWIVFRKWATNYRALLQKMTYEDRASYDSARPYEWCKIFKGRRRRNAFSNLVHRQYKSFPPDRFLSGGNQERNWVE